VRGHKFIVKNALKALNAAKNKGIDRLRVLKADADKKLISYRRLKRWSGRHLKAARGHEKARDGFSKDMKTSE